MQRSQSNKNLRQLVTPHSHQREINAHKYSVHLTFSTYTVQAPKPENGAANFQVGSSHIN